jgi:hypothetical protein
MAGKQVKTENKCIERIRHSKVKLSDPGTGRSVVLLNPDKTQVRRIRMDGCLMPVGHVAADSLVSMPRKVDVIVELKGKNVDHAAEQVEATRSFWSNHEGYQPNQLIGAWIMCSEYPRADLKIKRYIESFRQHGGNLLVSTRNGEERKFEEFIPRRL